MLTLAEVQTVRCGRCRAFKYVCKDMTQDLCESCANQKDRPRDLLEEVEKLRAELAEWKAKYAEAMAAVVASVTQDARR